MPKNNFIVIGSRDLEQIQIALAAKNIKDQEVKILDDGNTWIIRDSSDMLIQMIAKENKNIIDVPGNHHN